mgnify:CR=1 FL=1
MSFKDYLQSLRWNSFAKYPAQGSDVYIHCFAGDIHKFVRVRQFNAVCFDFHKIINGSSRVCQQQKLKKIMITQLLISVVMAISPFTPKTPVSDVPKQYAILNADEERKPTNRRDRRANKRRQK